ncbi:2-keto-4-pentenoate hydratase [Rhodococcus qingshengii]|uniref:Fumarylacetoacetase-like C-terminal domain-containing protein n=1 Tax=Rhodococcus qingshengii TaxID=334542 RepID=A0A2A5IY67_RHOSG|nr:fumarylacetoacetate hydrolase family protein [Rhodococcus qingshengii]PCK22052.1 hypothetical protein CHR55_33165 [Rhodococcus qingshengii]
MEEGAVRGDARVEDIADRLDGAAVHGLAVETLGVETLELAYQVQSALIERRLERGEAHAGWKLGFTSASKMRRMGVSQVIVGQLTSAMDWTADEPGRQSALIDPRAEPEVAFLVDRPVDCRQEPATALRSAVSGVAVAVEVIDSRYVDSKFGVGDVVADNASAVGFAVGPWLVASELSPLTDHEIELFVNGQHIAAGLASEILGDPWAALDAFHNVAREQGWMLQVGDVVLAGAVTAAVEVGRGDLVSARSNVLGTAQLRIPEP